MRGLWTLILFGCGNPCDQAADYLFEACDLVNRDDAAAECGRKDIARCEAECVLQTDCAVFDPPTQMSSDAFTAFLSTVKTYDDCVQACQPVTDITPEPDDTGL